MKLRNVLFIVIYSVIAFFILTTINNKIDQPVNNPAVYFEIPVTDLQRAQKFYSAVFGFDFTLENIHGNEMAFLPFNSNAPGITGALAKGEIYKPSHNGIVIYLGVKNIDETLAKAKVAGAKILFPKTQAGSYALVAEIEDSEGNRIGLNQSLDL